MLCDLGCGQLAEYFYQNWKNYCSHRAAKCPMRPKFSGHSAEARAKISQGMRKAHSERRAGFWGNRAKHRGERSYPELFFEKVIANEFQDKEYKSEVQIGRYRVDFLWEHKRRIIEIDGEQHEYPDNKKHDEIRDAWLISQGFSVFRISWKWFFHNPQEAIQLAKEFIDNATVVEWLKASGCNPEESKGSIPGSNPGRCTKPKKERIKVSKEERYKKVSETVRIKKYGSLENWEQIKQKRIEDLNLIDFRWGAVQQLAEMWGVSHTEVRRFIKKYTPYFQTLGIADRYP